MIRGNLGMAMQGLAVVPLFAGYDLDDGIGRIFSYDVTGGRYEEHSFHAVGSGSMFARGALKKRYRDGVERGRGRQARRRRALRRRRRRLARPAGPTSPAGSTRRHDRHRRGRCAGCPRTRSARRPGRRRRAHENPGG